jgi:hypothetical protein
MKHLCVKCWWNWHLDGLNIYPNNISLLRTDFLYGDAFLVASVYGPNITTWMLVIFWLIFLKVYFLINAILLIYIKCFIHLAALVITRYILLAALIILCTGYLLILQMRHRHYLPTYLFHYFFSFFSFYYFYYNKELEIEFFSMFCSLCSQVFGPCLSEKYKVFFFFPRHGLNFINILHTAFTCADPESVKRYWWLNCIFYAFGIYKHKCFL